MTLPAFTKGVYPMFDASEVLPGTPGVTDSTVVDKLRPSYVNGVSLFVYARDLWQNQTDGQAEAVTYIGHLLDQIDLHATAAGRGTLPVIFRIYPTVAPAWLTTGLSVQTVPTHLRDAQLGIDWVGFPAGVLIQGIDFMPYPHTTAYQGFVRNLRSWAAAGLAAADPTGARVPVVHYCGPAAQSNNMALPGAATWPTDGSPDPQWQTGAFTGDSTANAWTYPKHLAAFQTFATEMAGVSAFQHRWWLFNYTALTVTATDQNAVLATLTGEHADGSGAVFAKQENMRVGAVDTSVNPAVFSNLWRQAYRANIAGSGSAAADWWVQNHQPHGFELFSPFATTNGSLAAHYQNLVTPNTDGTPSTTLDFTELIGNFFHTSFTTDWGGSATGSANPSFLEPWSRDLAPQVLSDRPTWAKALDDASRIMRGTLDSVIVRGHHHNRFVTLSKGGKS